MKKEYIIKGDGIAGKTLAILLAQKGYRIKILSKNKTNQQSNFKTSIDGIQICVL